MVLHMIFEKDPMTGTTPTFLQVHEFWKICKQLTKQEIHNFLQWQRLCQWTTSEETSKSYVWSIFQIDVIVTKLLFFQSFKADKKFVEYFKIAISTIFFLQWDTDFVSERQMNFFSES